MQPIHIFKMSGADEVKENQLFIAHKDSVEGRTRATLKPLITENPYSKYDDMTTICHILKEEYDEIDKTILAGIKYLLTCELMDLEEKRALA